MANDGYLWQPAKAHPVTAPKPTTKKAVDRVFYSLAEALRPELRIENVGDRSSSAA